MLYFNVFHYTYQSDNVLANVDILKRYQLFVWCAFAVTDQVVYQTGIYYDTAELYRVCCIQFTYIEINSINYL